MTDGDVCGGCAPAEVDGVCRGSFHRVGVLKAHWECWSECNLGCPFCYRTRGNPLGTGEGRLLLRALATGGVTSVVFAGGDPSLRQDLGQLVDVARSLGMRTEVQTNAHLQKQDFLKTLARVDLVGLSIDGPDEEIHDQFRNKPGNFRRVLSLLEYLHSLGKPVIVRSIVSSGNHDKVGKIRDILDRHGNILRWSLLEFSPIGQGFSNKIAYEIDRALFDEVAVRARDGHSGSYEINVYRSEAKAGTYLLITPDGRVYGTGAPALGGRYPIIGSIVSDHLGTLAAALPFDRDNHYQRYSRDLASVEHSATTHSVDTGNDTHGDEKTV